MKKLVLVDGMAVLHRAYHAYPLALTTAKGEIVNAVYGFTAIVLTVIEKLKPTHVAVTWDVGKPTFRHTEYVEYKATREAPDRELIDQIERTKQVVETLNIPQFGVEGYEADDLIGTLSRQAGRDCQVVIVTGDRDTLQLVDEERVIVYMPPASGKYAKDRGPQIIDEVAFETKYELKPEQMVDLKALMGDASDNIPGVKGVGPKTATKLLKEYPTIERLYGELDEARGKIVNLVGERVVQLLERDRDMAKLSKRLAMIDRDVPISLDWDKCKLADYDRAKALEVFEELQFRSLIKRLPKDSWEEDVEEVFT